MLVRQLSPDHWVVNLDSELKSEVTIEVRMSRKTAERIASLETSRIKKLNPNRDIEPRTPGWAVQSVLDLFAEAGRVPDKP